MKALGLKLLRAESEDEVAKIIKSDHAMSAGGSWYPVDDRVTNFNIITNQSSTGGKAATELITNMVDAMLMKRCHEEDIDPKGKDAPSTMYRAVDDFVQKMNGGRIIDADGKWLRKYAMKNLVIGVTGATRTSEGYPCYTFADNGEGQHPKKFPETFLSLSAKNKSQIPFVQGKYNMGSSGVLNFCGEHWFKLIVSRRFDKSGPWGWTLIRRRPGESDEMPVAEYFAPDNEIPMLENLGNLSPLQNRNREEFSQFQLESGTVVKLYDFYAGKNFSAFRGAREAFNENLVETILPFRIYDLRWPPDAERGGLRALGIDARPFYGMEFLLRRSHKDDVDLQDGEEEVHEAIEAGANALSIGTITHPRLGKIILTAVPIKKDLPPSHWFRKSNNRIFHHVNGQVQFKQSRGFLSQCRLPALKDRVAVFVDASGLKDKAHQDIWKGDRESIRETLQGENYKEEIKEKLEKSDVLKNLHHRIAREALDSAAKESSLELVRELVKRDRNLALLLDQKYPDLPAPPPPDAPRPSLVEHKYSPTFIRIQGTQIHIDLPINRTRPIPCVTDAAVDYLTRAANRGTLHFEDDKTADLFTFNTTHDEIGNLIVFIRPDKERMQVGDKHEFKIGLKDDALPEPVYIERAIRITIVKKAAPPRPSPPPPPPPSPPIPPAHERGLPPPLLLTKDGREIDGKPTEKWEAAELSGPVINEHDGGGVKDLGDQGKMYYINYDNAFFQNYLKAQKGEGDRAAVTQKYILGMRIALLGMEHSLASKTSDEENGFDEDQFRRLAAKGAAAVIMTLCDQLPKSFDLDADKGRGNDE